MTFRRGGRFGRQQKFSIVWLLAAIAITMYYFVGTQVGDRSGARAQAPFDTPQTFTVTSACEATRAIRGGEPVTLEPGQSFAASGLNRKSVATHVLITVDGASKWVALSCGKLGAAVAGMPGTRPDISQDAPRGDTQTSRQCLPFFDDTDNPIPRPAAFGGRADITPPPPKLDAFDRALMATCGPAGKVVGAREFKTMMRAHPAVLERIRSFTGGRVFGNRSVAATVDAYLDQLTAAWFDVKAFDHIMCGEPKPSGESIGGLHFHGRYLQLQQSGEACRLPNYQQNEIVPGTIYTMGVEMKAANGAMARDARKGFGLTLSGEDILKTVTRAFADNPTGGNESEGCLLPITDDGRNFTAVFVRRAAGIRTFYPDATPYRGGRRNPPCSGAITVE